MLSTKESSTADIDTNFGVDQLLDVNLRELVDKVISPELSSILIVTALIGLCVKDTSTVTELPPSLTSIQFSDILKFAGVSIPIDLSEKTIVSIFSKMIFWPAYSDAEDFPSNIYFAPSYLLLKSEDGLP